MADIFDEVSEELKQDKLIQVWKKYSKFIISASIILIISIASYNLYLNWRQKKLETSSEKFFDALENLENKKNSNFKNLFFENFKEQNEGYRILSLFGLAETNFKNGKIDEMISIYNSIYKDNSIDLYYRNLARMLSVVKDNLSSFDHQEKILRPILESPSNFQVLAAELEIMLLIRFDKINEAKTKLKTLLNRSNISVEQKSRLELINKIYYLHEN